MLTELEAIKISCLIMIKCLNTLSQVVLVVKNLRANTGDVRNTGLIPGSGRSLGGGHGSPLQYSCLEDPMDRETWWAIVYRVTKSDMTEVT